jgi:3-hydroxybutyrate dehydrogenase
MASAATRSARGYVHTPLVDAQITDTAKARGISEDEVVKNVILAAQPTKEFVTAEQIGEMAAFLCSPAASQINGALLPVDGGWTAQ